MGKVRQSGRSLPSPKRPTEPVTIQKLADYLRLSKATISAVFNETEAARTIPQETRDRIFKAAEECNYRPNYVARALRHKRSMTVALIVPEISEGYNASLIAGVEDTLLREGYLYFVVSHRNQERLIEEYPRLLIDRAVEGLVLVNTPYRHQLKVPVVSISGREKCEGVTRIILDNRKACWLAMEHLVNLGHRRIAFFKGHPGSADTLRRWQGIRTAADSMGIDIRPELTVQLHGITGLKEPSTPDEGYAYAKILLERNQPFTALFAFNDISALGAMSAFRDAGYRIPSDISVIGFDDIKAAAFQNPRLTTVRQPLHEIGELAATTLLKRIANPQQHFDEIMVEPELVVRESTGAARDLAHHTASAT